MPPRSKSLAVLTFVLFAVYLLFWHNDNSPGGLNYDRPPSSTIVDAYLKDMEAAEEAEAARNAAEWKAKGYTDLSEDFVEPDPPIAPPEPPQVIEEVESSTNPDEVTIATADPVPPPPSGPQTHSRLNLKEDFERDYATLGL
jgi:cell division septation protein DedD